MFYLLIIFKYLQFVNEKRLMNKKHSSVLNLQIMIAYSNQENFLKIHHALCKHNIDFLRKFLLEKGKYLVIESYFCVE